MDAADALDAVGAQGLQVIGTQRGVQLQQAAALRARGAKVTSMTKVS
ncbi:hypothetical protein ACLEJW_21910 [Pseudomonas sp. SMSB3]